MEPSRPPDPARRADPARLSGRAAHASRRRFRDTSGVPVAISNGALAAGGVLALSGRGDLWTLAVAFGVADGSVLTAVTLLVAGVATLARTGSASLTDIAGAQAVLGAAGFTGSAAGIGAAWASGLSLLGVARQRVVGAVLGVVAGLLVAGPSLSGGFASVIVWVIAAVVGAAVGWYATPASVDGRRWQRYAAVVLGCVGVALGVVAGYH